MPSRTLSTRWMHWIVGLALIVGSVEVAHAQSQVCGQIRSELAQLGATSGGGGATRESMQLRSELSRIQLAIRQNDCGRTGFLGIGGPPPVCSPLRAQAGQIEAQIRQIEGGSGTTGQRRQQLIIALERYGCLGPPPGQLQAQQPPQQRGVIYAVPNEPGLMERLMGQTVDGRDDMRLDGDGSLDTAPRERLGGRMAVCVRTCDGFYFPVNFEGIGARDEYAQVCQSLCPAAETQLFFMPLGAEIDRAATRDGTPYTSLPAAKKYQTKLDPACFCKQPTQTWASAMRGIEDLVEARKGDIVVSAEQAQAMSRPKPPGATTDRKGLKNDPARPETAATLPAGGETQPAIGADGTRRTIRNVAPGLTAKEQPIDLRGATRP